MDRAALARAELEFAGMDAARVKYKCRTGRTVGVKLHAGVYLLRPQVHQGVMGSWNDAEAVVVFRHVGEVVNHRDDLDFMPPVKVANDVAVPAFQFASGLRGVADHQR